MRARRVAVTTAVVVALLAGCGDPGTGPVPRRGSSVDIPAPAGLVVTEPIAGAPATPPAQSGGGPGLVYVSLRSGTMPDGVRALVYNREAGVGVTAAMRDGGFDPVLITGSAGDTLDVTVVHGDSTQAHLLLVVPVRRRPVIVRTVPPPGRRDMPLNSSMIIVFSEPLDTASLQPGVVMLRRSGGPVEGQARFVDPSHTVVAFTPSDILAPTSDYLLSVGTGIADLSGDRLEAPVDVAFSTASGGTAAVTPTPGLAFWSKPASARVNQPIVPSVLVAVVDSIGNPVAALPGDSIALELVPPGGALRGTLRTRVVGGVADFHDLAVVRVGTGYQLRASLVRASYAGPASAPGVFTPPFDVRAPDAVTAWVGVTPPPSVQVGTLFTLFVGVGDAPNTLASHPGDSVVLQVLTGRTGLRGNLSQPVINGTARFDDLAFTAVDSDVVLRGVLMRWTGHASEAVADGLSKPFRVRPAPNSYLLFTSQPPDTVAGARLSPAIEVTAYDAQGRVRSGNNDLVVLTIPANGSRLSGTTARRTVNGVARFDDLSVTGIAGTGGDTVFVMIATSAGLLSTNSRYFKVRPGPLGGVRIRPQVPNLVDGLPVPYPICVVGVDGSGNELKGFADTVRLSMVDGSPVGVLSGRLVWAGTDCASDLNIVSPGSGYRLVVSSVAGSDTTAPFDVLPDSDLIAFETESGISMTRSDGAAWGSLPIKGTTVAWSPDGLRMVYAAQGAGLTIANADGTARAPLTGTGGDSRPAWSPDGQWIAFGRQPDLAVPSALYVVRTDGTGLRRVADGYGPSWSPDGARIVFARSDSLFTINQDGTGETFLALGTYPAWSPDGTLIALGRCAAVSSLCTIRPDGTGLTVIVGVDQGCIVAPAWSPDGADLALIVGGCVDNSGTRLAVVTPATGQWRILPLSRVDRFGDDIAFSKGFPAWRPR